MIKYNTWNVYQTQKIGYNIKWFDAEKIVCVEYIDTQIEIPTGSMKSEICARRDAIIFIFIILQYFIQKNYKMI